MPSKRNYRKEIEDFLPQNALEAVFSCAKTADETGVNIFLVGGIVRDILSNILFGAEKINRAVQVNIDITVEGNAIEFAQSLEKKHPQTCKIKETHDSFTTAKVILTHEKKELETIEIDIASTRAESYPYPSSLPKVELIGCPLAEDVLRRDFSVNSMAFSINKDSFGELRDYLGGYEDLKNKKLRILHEKSFIDDPTRIIRGLKFRVRFNFELDEKTRQLQQECLNLGMFDNLCTERVKLELKQAFNLNQPQCLKLYFLEEIYRLVNVDSQMPSSSWECQKVYPNELGFNSESANPPFLKTNATASPYPVNDFCEKSEIQFIRGIISEYIGYISTENIWLIYLGVTLCSLQKESLIKTKEKLFLKNNETEILIEAWKLSNKKPPKKDFEIYEIYEFFEGKPNESILIFLIKNLQFKEQIDLYFKELQKIKIFSTGDTLIEMGLKPSSEFKRILREVLKAKINGKLSSQEDEISFIRNTCLP